jgi:hypothetical protein
MSTPEELFPSNRSVDGQAYKSDIASHHIRDIMPKSLSRDILELAMSCGDSSKTAKFLHSFELIKNPFKPDLKRYYQPEGSYAGLRIMTIENQRKEYEALRKDFQYVNWIACEVETGIKNMVSATVQHEVSELRGDAVDAEAPRGDAEAPRADAEAPRADVEALRSAVQELSAEVARLKNKIDNTKTGTRFALNAIALIAIVIAILYGTY